MAFSVLNAQLTSVLERTRESGMEELAAKFNLRGRMYPEISLLSLLVGPLPGRLMRHGIFGHHERPRLLAVAGTESTRCPTQDQPLDELTEGPARGS